MGSNAGGGAREYFARLGSIALARPRAEGGGGAFELTPGKSGGVRGTKVALSLRSPDRPRRGGGGAEAEEAEEGPGCSEEGRAEGEGQGSCQREERESRRG